MLQLPLHRGAAAAPQEHRTFFHKTKAFSRHFLFRSRHTQACTERSIPFRAASPFFKRSVPRADGRPAPAGARPAGGGAGQGKAGRWVSGGRHPAGPGPMRRQRHGRQEHGLQLARHAGDLRVLRLVRLDQPGELQDPCKTRRLGKAEPARPLGGPAAPRPASGVGGRGHNPPSPSLLKP